MSNSKIYKDVFINSLSIESHSGISLYFNFSENLLDSIGHMTLMSGLEDAFKIALETDDIIDFSSYEKGKEILKKYKVNF